MSSAKIEYHIRLAEEKDVDAIRGLIVELAVYEKEPDAVKATPELLKQNLFGPTPYANCLIAVAGPASEPGETIAMALYFFNYSTWTGRPGLYLEDLIVTEKFRGSGVAKSLFAGLAEVAQQRNCARMDWSVLKWNQPSIDFYEKRLKAKMMSEWVGMRLVEDDGGIEALKQLGRS